ncbi:MAG TPA: hypothetical protein VER58_13125 [Thermoanaerobaculia bacterium]|nr:hypothetical protein [Thermoanaerobaculia bacterium]
MDYQIVGTLGALSKDFPAETLRCVRLIVVMGMDMMKVHALTYRGDVQRIIRAALSSGDEQLQKYATAFANELVARGFSGFRDVLNSDYDQAESEDGRQRRAERAGVAAGLRHRAHRFSWTPAAEGVVR